MRLRGPTPRGGVLGHPQQRSDRQSAKAAKAPLSHNYWQLSLTNTAALVVVRHLVFVFASRGLLVDRSLPMFGACAAACPLGCNHKRANHIFISTWNFFKLHWPGLNGHRMRPNHLPSSSWRRPSGAWLQKRLTSRSLLLQHYAIHAAMLKATYNALRGVQKPRIYYFLALPAAGTPRRRP